MTDMVRYLATLFRNIISAVYVPSGLISYGTSRPASERRMALSVPHGGSLSPVLLSKAEVSMAGFSAHGLMK